MDPNRNEIVVTAQDELNERKSIEAVAGTTQLRHSGFADIINIPCSLLKNEARSSVQAAAARL